MDHKSSVREVVLDSPPFQHDIKLVEQDLIGKPFAFDPLPIRPKVMIDDYPKERVWQQRIAGAEGFDKIVRVAQQIEPKSPRIVSPDADFFAGI